MYICIYCHGLLLPLRPVSSRLVSSRFSPFFSTLVPWPADAFSKSVSMRIRPLAYPTTYIVYRTIVHRRDSSRFRFQEDPAKRKEREDPSLLLAIDQISHTPHVPRDPIGQSANAIHHIPIFVFAPIVFSSLPPPPSHSSYDFFVSTDGSDRETRYITRTTESPVEERGSIA